MKRIRKISVLIYVGMPDEFNYEETEAESCKNLDPTLIPSKTKCNRVIRYDFNRSTHAK